MSWLVACSSRPISDFDSQSDPVQWLCMSWVWIRGVAQPDPARAPLPLIPFSHLITPLSLSPRGALGLGMVIARVWIPEVSFPSPSPSCSPRGLPARAPARRPLVAPPRATPRPRPPCCLSGLPRPRPASPSPHPAAPRPRAPVAPLRARARRRRLDPTPARPFPAEPPPASPCSPAVPRRPRTTRACTVPVPSARAACSCACDVVALRSTLILIHFNSSLVDVLCRALRRATVHSKFVFINVLRRELRRATILFNLYLLKYRVARFVAR
jgi:hypothetical protein